MIYDAIIKIILYSTVACFYLGIVIWAFKDWLDQDNILIKEQEAWYNESDDDEDTHLGI